MPDGPAVFAWTWFNRIGNREMYMTCAPIVVTGGGAGNASFVEALPPVFRANIPGECTTGPSGNLIGFPDPGLYGVLYDAPAPGSSGSCPPGVAPVFEGDPPDQGRGSVAASTTTPLPGVGSSSPSQTPETASYAASPLPESSPKPATISPAPTPVTGGSDARPAPTLPSAAPTGAPSGDRPDWAAGMVPCSPAGELVCLEPGFFGICNHGWTVPQRLAADQVCVDGSVELAEPR
ncbi:hypothetical protein VTK73DRAFT_2811 [Phialemonium thermophilum]|uniref:Uncharacterized protein n=1 Tax=Phialemonium thermophilum TaxID=223376 RepID=A0ABR3VNZ9_9PEZI